MAADTGHVGVDGFGLVVAIIAAFALRRPASNRLSYGLIRAEGVAATIQAFMITGICVVIGIEGISRFFHPHEIDGLAMSGWAVAGLIGNVIAMVVMAGGRHENLNIKAAFLEVSIDAVSSVGVIIAGLLVRFTGWAQIDACISLIIACAMIPRGISLFRQAGALLFDSVPAVLSTQEVLDHINSVDGVVEAHDLHIWQPKSGLILLTAHVTVDDDAIADGRVAQILHDLQECMAKHFPEPIEHATFQLESQTHAGHEHFHH